MGLEKDILLVLTLLAHVAPVIVDVVVINCCGRVIEFAGILLTGGL